MANAKIRKGMILAAGLGTRMAPITDSMPKPVVPVLNIPNIVHNVCLLKHAGIEEFVINTFHLGDHVTECLGDGSSLGVKIQYSKEEILLGTGGGVKNAEPLFDGEAFVLCNCDLVTDIDLAPVIDFHFQKKSIATMVLIDDASFKHKYAEVGTTAEGFLCQLPSCKTQPPKRTGTFTGIHVLQPEAHNYMEAVFSGINQVLYPALMKESPDRVFGYFAEEQGWYDTGEVPIYHETSMKLLDFISSTDPKQAHFKKHLHTLLQECNYQEIEANIWREKSYNPPQAPKTLGTSILGKSCEIATSATVGPSAIIGDNVQVGENAIIENSVVMPGSRVGDKQSIRDTILFGDKQLPIK